MAVILANPLLLEDETSSEIVQLQILVQEEDWKGLYDQIEVWRSRDTSSGPYEELTGSSWVPARLPAGAGDEPAAPVTGRSVTLNGLTLELKVNETDDLTVTFSGVDPFTYAGAATQIAAQGAGLVHSYVDEDGVLVIQTLQSGTAAALEVTGGDAAPALGLSTLAPDSLAYGHDARIALVAGTESYLFADIRGSNGYFYKLRFRSRTNGATSAFSQAFQVGQAIGLSTSNIVMGTLSLVSLDGKPLSNVEVAVYNTFKGELVEGKLVAEGSQSKLTDSAGRVDFYLVRGTRLTVAVNGTSIVREIVVPTDSSVKTFPLLGEDVGTSDDHWTVQVPDIVYAERRSL